MKNRIIWSILTIVILSTVGIFTAIWISNGGWPASGPKGDILPPHIQYVSPQDGEQVTNAHGFCVGFDFHSGNRLNEDQQNEIQFFLDGKNVSGHMHQLVELEYPTGIAELCYRENDPLASGWHTIVVRYADVNESSHRYRWTFSNPIDE
jgi:hypothetical protein